jgi:hypothetical protein
MQYRRLALLALCLPLILLAQAIDFTTVSFSQVRLAFSATDFTVVQSGGLTSVSLRTQPTPAKITERLSPVAVTMLCATRPDQLYRNGLFMTPSVDYTWSAGTITWTAQATDPADIITVIRPQ